MKSGFTLIELSIVLVIIGLIIGGILTGQDLINAAEQRATLAQIEKYNTAVNTFRNKFGGIPGDLQYTLANNFGLYAMGNASGGVGKAGYGDGNGLIEGGTSNSSLLEGETLAFFRQLSDANLIDGSYAPWGTTAGTLAGSSNATSTGLLAAVTPAAMIGNLFPLAKIGRGNYIAPFSVSGINYFVITGMAGTTGRISAGQVQNGFGDYLTANEAYNMDKKIDDGLPGSGSVFAWYSFGTSCTDSFTCNNATLSNAAIVSTNSGCVTASGTYAVTSGSGIQACSLRFQFQ